MSSTVSKATKALRVTDAPYWLWGRSRSK